jgi:hypothetical protein
MLEFTNSYSAVLYVVAITMAVAGFLTFVAQVMRWDSEYEKFLIFPLRFTIYALPFIYIPFLGLVIGALMIRSEKRVKRKFAKGAMYVSTFGLLLWITTFGTVVR